MLRLCCLFWAFLLSTTVLAASELRLEIYGASATQNAQFAAVEAGIELFAEIVERHCSVKLEAMVLRKKLPVRELGFHFDPSLSVAPSGPFRYFQKSMYELTTSLRLEHRPGTVSLFLADELPRHCGFAFPPVQFEASQARVVPWVVNRVALALPGDNCANYSRLVAHELGHIFVQDNPPHLCPAADVDALEPCSRDNLMAVRELVAEEWSDHQPWRRPRREDPMQPEYRDARGTYLNKAQCEQVRASLKSL